METVSDAIKGSLADIWNDFAPDGAAMPEWTPDTVLLESGLDSLAFAALVADLEDRLGIDPFAEATEAYYPRTLGELIAFYEAATASR